MRNQKKSRRKQKTMRKTQAVISLAGVIIGQASASYNWGNACSSLTDQHCADVDCADCRWSWPENAHWNDSRAACRCAKENE